MAGVRSCFRTRVAVSAAGRAGLRNRLYLTRLGPGAARTVPSRREGRVVTQQGQVFELKRQNREGERLWAYRYRLEGRGSRRVQRGGFASEQDAAAALERELDRVRRERRIPHSLTLA